MANARDERHRFGRHYTPPEVARLLAALAVRSPGDLVFDPSCGDGRLLEEALRLKRRLSTRRRSDFTGHVFGVELSASALEEASRTGAGVGAADFFDVEPGASLNLSTPKGGKDACAPGALPLEFDAVIGNPPYIRQETIGSKGKRRIEARLARDVAACPDVCWPHWSGRSDIYVYFFAHSLRFLKERGRLVFLTASSWLDAGYGAPLREFLLKNFRVIAVIESGVESFFADASINTCITVLEREPDSQEREDHSIRFVRFNRALSDILGKDAGRRADRADSSLRFAGDILHREPSSPGESFRMRSVAQAALLSALETDRTNRTNSERGWGKYLRADEVFFQIIKRGSSKMLSLSKLANVRFGVKTGANEFFYVRGEEQGAKDKRRRVESDEQGRESTEQCGKSERPGLLALGDVASVRRGITTGANEFFYLKARSDEKGAWATRAKGSTHGLMVVRDSAGKRREIETELLAPVVFSLKEISGILLDRIDARRLLFNCSLLRRDLMGARAFEYIKSGERAGYHRRPTCSNREPWYSVARGMKPAPLIFPSKVGERWLVALNRARVFEDKKLYGVFPARGVSVLALAALLNSTWARYYTEATCRQMTGAQAIADIDVAVAEQILVPDPRKLAPSIKRKLEAALVELWRRPVVSVFDEIKRADRRRLDTLTLEAIGFSNAPEREAVLDKLYDAVTKLVRARVSRGRRQ